MKRLPKILVTEDRDASEWIPEAERCGPRELTTGVGCFKDGRYKSRDETRDGAKGVRIVLAEQDLKHTQVYLGIHTRAFGHDEVIEGPVASEQIDQLIDLLCYVRDEARKIGVLPAKSRVKRKTSKT
ncbi:MAG: hypothetical protein ABIU86_11110 [Gemmatimonadaceae bacterium]